MQKTRVEAFSDGVLAIILTIMVLELKVPHNNHQNDTIEALIPLLPVFLSYLLSFIYIGIYWNNHHHLFQAVQQINGKVLWANNHLLFWLSLIPFATAWMGENKFTSWPVAVYGIILLMAGIAYYILVKTLINQGVQNLRLAKVIGKDNKGKISIVGYMIGILCTFLHSYIGCIFYILIALMWLTPDKRIEKGIESI